MPGRKKIPDKLKALRGTKRKDRDNPTRPNLPPCSVDCPYPLFGVALKAWNQLSQELTKIKVLTKADLQALKLLCEAIAEYDSLLLRVWEDRPNGEREYVPTVNLYQIYEKGKKKKLSIPVLVGIKTKPEVAMLAENRKFQKAMLEQFGLTPSSRVKVWTIGSPPPGPEKTKLQMMREKRAARKAAKNQAS
ncbi:hypothetical protein LCGC14_1794710 [marine sediment metagenome]|uniref:Phage terminase small subunit P27 family n=1 Tax=marine sediment metagenome TaxID=412755 RepID=A0A0F9HE60_9ZZZZ